jgi:hypothetical protein
MAQSDSESEATTTVLTEPGFSEGRDERHGPGRVAAADPDAVAAYRQWWRANPLNNLRPGGKTNLWARFRAETVEGKSPLEAAQGPYTQTLDDLARCVFSFFFGVFFLHVFASISTAKLLLSQSITPSTPHHTQ